MPDYGVCLSSDQREGSINKSKHWADHNLYKVYYERLAVIQASQCLYFLRFYTKYILDLFYRMV